LASENYYQPESKWLPYGNSFGINLARNNIPRPYSARQPYSRSSRHRNVISNTVCTKWKIPLEDFERIRKEYCYAWIEA